MNIARRAFLKSSATSALVATGMAGGLSVFDPEHVFGADTILIPHASHWGPFKAVVKSGVLVGVQTIDDVDARPTRMLTEGLLSRVYHASRIKYPMVRKSYLLNRAGDAKPELRGREAFVRVSWDDAIALAADAILDTIETHGNEALFSTSYGGWSHAGILRPHVLQGRLFGLIGGHSVTVGDYSVGASRMSLAHVMGGMEVFAPQTSWEVIAEKTEVMVLIGCDPWNNNRIESGVADHQMLPRWEKIKQAGVRFISINPQYTATDEAMGAEWVKIIPNTDTALFLAMSYYVYTKGLHDQAYLEQYTVGFDRFLPYLLGKSGDGTAAKTPQWAAGITGVPAEQIVQLAELCAAKRTQLAGAWSLQRADHGEMSHWAIVNFAAMLGKIGKPGEGAGFSWHYGAGAPSSGKTMPRGLPQGRNPINGRCPASRLSEMLLNPGKKYTRDGAEYAYPDAHLIYNAGNNFMSHQQNTNELIRAMNKKIETVICHDPWWCASARFADIVFPATTTLERNDISSGGAYSNDKIYAMRQVIEPVGESLDDFEIFRRLADQFGVAHQFTESSMSVMAILENSYKASGATMPFEEFWDTGMTRLEVPEAAHKWVLHGDFLADPQKNPLHTASGKIELYCGTIAGFECEECPPMPQWMEPAEYLGNAEEGQVHVVSPHPHMRVHSQMANAATREYENVQGRQHLRISVEDARANGIEDGDLVELYNERGALIAGARVTDLIRKGVVSLEEGNWLQLDSRGRCNSGSINMITSSKACSDLSQATSANTCIASIRKCTDAESENRAYEPPVIEEHQGSQAVSARGFRDRAAKIRNAALADMTPGEKLFYERCTVCHVAHEPGDLTRTEWRAVTEDVMFPRAGLSEEQQQLVREFLSNNAKDAR